MPNIIINNYCNQSCSYCFANENMKNKNLQKDMNILTYLKILKFLKINGEKEVRILG
jgi:sulfatase maturation enzyme AslB (radical SAM superfamily)